MTLATLGLVLAAVGPAAAAAAGRPHLVMALTDDLGWNYPGYHNPEVHTPTLDALAAEGVRLESHCEPNEQPSCGCPVPDRGPAAQTRTSTALPRGARF